MASRTCPTCRAGHDRSQALCATCHAAYMRAWRAARSQEVKRLRAALHEVIDLAGRGTAWSLSTRQRVVNVATRALAPTDDPQPEGAHHG